MVADNISLTLTYQIDRGGEIPEGCPSFKRNRMINTMTETVDQVLHAGHG